MALLPPNPNTQALKATDFVVPPLDGSLNISQVIDFNAKHSPHHPFFRYDDPSTRFVDVSWRAIQRATYRAAQIVQSYEVRSDAGASRVIAILALVDTISYFTLILGILRAGYIPFPLSPQNSPAVIARLLGKTKTAHIFVSEDQSMLELSAEALKVLAGQGGQVVERLPTPFYDELYAARLKEDTILPARSTEMSSVALYLHTSGK
jgi:acyl-CoA synthetase (AMP-forming)/AMP-acid ligase II